MNVVVNGLMANYQKIGSGKPLILLHGWGDSANTFSKLVDILQENYEIYALDLPGFGASQPPKEAWGLADYANFARCWINKIGIHQQYYLLGHSFGGAVATVGVAQSMLKPKKLVLLAASGVRDRKPLTKKAMRLATKAGHIPLYLLPQRKAQKIKLKLYKLIGSDFLLIPHMQETFKLVVRQDIRPLASKINVPTLLVYGNRDKETPPPDGHALSRSIRGSRMDIINAGHFLHQEEPEKISRLIENFLED